MFADAETERTAALKEQGDKLRKFRLTKELAVARLELDAVTKIDDVEVFRQFNEQEATLPILGIKNDLLQDYLATQASSVSNVRSAPSTLETDVCSLVNPAKIEPIKLHKEKKQFVNSQVNQDKADSKPQDNADLPVIKYLWSRFREFFDT